MIDVLIVIVVAVGKRSHHKKLPDFLFGCQRMKDAIDPMFSTIRHGEHFHWPGGRAKFVRSNGYPIGVGGCCPFGGCFDRCCARKFRPEVTTGLC
jgi:hypothetical protein